MVLLLLLALMVQAVMVALVLHITILAVGISGSTGAVFVVEGGDVAAVVLVGFAGIAADGHDNAFHELVIGGVVADAFFDPRVPLF